MSKEITQKLVDTYFTNMAAMNADGWLSIFAEDALIYDPVDNPPKKIYEDAKDFFALISFFFAKMEVTQDYVFIASNEAATKWKMSVVAKNGKTASCDGISVFTINEAGKIQEVRSYWERNEMMAKLK